MNGWEGLNAAIAEVREMVAREAPDPETAAEGEAYVARIVTAALAPAFMGHRLQESGLAMPLPVYGGPNPDYIMRHAVVDPEGTYRLEGTLNGSERVGVGLYAIGRGGAPTIAGYAAFDRGNCAPDGSFALDIAAGLAGPGTLALPAEARILMLRVLHRDASQPARLALAGLPEQRGPTLTTGTCEGALAHVARTLGANVSEYMKWVAAARALPNRLAAAPEQRGPTLATGTCEGALAHVARTLRANVSEYMKWVAAARALPNRLAAAPEELAETITGDADTQYFLGGFDLADGEWLEVILPGNLSGYWSLHAYNFWYEHLVTPGVHDRNAVVGADGTVRIMVGPQAPANAANRIDTLGRRKGAFVCRIVGHGSAIAPPEAVLHRPGGA